MFRDSYRLRKIKPLTQAQAQIFQSFENDRNIVAYGVSGSGKTWVSLYLAFEQILSGQSKYSKLIIVRSAVPTREIGYLPGGLGDKLLNYELPYIDICNHIFGDDVYESLKKDGIIEFLSTSYLRGLTIVNSIVIFDEAQNGTFHENESLITRLGKNSKIIFCGDEAQTDLPEREKIKRKDFFNILENTGEFDFVEFDENDVVRSGLVKNYIIQKKKYYQS